MYGFIFCHFFDAAFGRFKKEHFQCRIDGIEIFEEYLSDIQYLVYDNLYIGDAFDLIDSLGKYDVILASEVVEHFPKEKGYQFIEKMFKHTENIVIATPYPDCWQEQGMLYGNENEKHLSKWTEEDFKNYDYTTTIVIPSYIVELQPKYRGKIGVGLVAYGNTNLLFQTIESLKRTTTVEYEMAVFDNSLADSDTRRELEKHTDIVLLPHEKYQYVLPPGWPNIGCYFGRNRLIEYFINLTLVNRKVAYGFYLGSWRLKVNPPY